MCNLYNLYKFKDDMLHKIDDNQLEMSYTSLRPSSIILSYKFWENYIITHLITIFLYHNKNSSTIKDYFLMI